MKAAVRLQNVKDNWETQRGELDDALTFNRKLWVILTTSATSADNPLPVTVKESIGSLGLFVFKHTISVLANPAPERLNILINVNRDIAAGLRGR
ncbi:hypothetical protein BOSEA31B_14355 [Hyphomicrobiales bacterium]|nr:hypothetical protein BOSEA31B_14355 [Hyphomicrobiales bacterium]CAH1700134.1 hypothetical protein BOSEA1005_13187 [Hyphomicrobiales bacterium]CAI0343896.1 flagellar protein FlaF [Hyphomicrobiales bacterium]